IVLVPALGCLHFATLDQKDALVGEAIHQSLDLISVECGEICKTQETAFLFDCHSSDSLLFHHCVEYWICRSLLYFTRGFDSGGSSLGIRSSLSRLEFFCRHILDP